jgi:AAA family ATP:ADP antiporter
VQPEVQQLLQDDDLETRTEALAYMARHAHLDPLTRIRELGDFHDVSVRAAMVAFLARPGETQNLEAARAIIEAMLAEPGPDGRRAKLELAGLMASLPDEFGTQLGRLLQERDIEIARQAVRAVGRLQKRELVREVIDLLAQPELAADAAQALAGIGERIVGTLRDRLFDPAAPVEVRREIPGVLARIGTPFAQAVLMESLLESDPTLRFRIVASLNSLRQTDAEVAIDTRVVETVLAAEIIGHYRSYQILGSLEQALQGDDPAVRALKQSMDQEVERIFRLMALLYPHLDLHGAYRGLVSADAAVRANALELVDNILRPSLRHLVVPLLDGQVSVGQRVALANRLVGAPVETAEQAVQALVASGDPWLKACAAHAIGAMRLTSLEGELDKWLDDSDPLLRETARSAKRRLAEPSVSAIEPEPPSPVRGWEASDRMGVG